MHVPRTAPLAVLLVVGTVGAACRSAPTEENLRRAIVVAAVTESGQIARLSKRGVDGGMEFLDSIADQRLTVAFLALSARDPGCSDDGAYVMERDFEPAWVPLGSEFDGSAVAECLVRPPSRRGALGWLETFGESLQRGDPYPLSSVIWDEYITGIEFTRDGDTVTGVVSYEAPGCYRGDLPFVARRDGRKWRVEEFELSVLGWRVVLGENGLWKTTPLAEDPPPSLAELEGRAGDFLVLRVMSDGGLAVPDGPSSWLLIDDLPMRVGGRRVALISGPETTIGNLLTALEKLREAEPAISTAELVLQRQIDDRSSSGAATVRPELLTDGVPVRLGFDIALSPYFCIGRSQILVSTGREMPLPLARDSDAFDFAAYEVSSRQTAKFLINANPEVPYERLDMVLQALVRSGASRVILATGRYRGIILHRRSLPP